MSILADIFHQRSIVSAMASSWIGLHSALDPAGPAALQIERLYWFIFWIAVVAFVLVLAFFTRAVLRSRIPSTPPAPTLPESTGRAMGMIAIGSALGVTILLLFVILILSIVTGKYAQDAKQKDVLTIDVTGHQWWWEVRYTDPQASLTVEAANEIHIPVGQPVVIETASDDVIHSFWVPNLQGKRDLLPGYRNAIWIQADKPGRYRGQCAEYCGYQHAHMGFEVVAEDSSQVQQWLAAQRQPAPDPDTPEKARGREVFLSHDCALCHTIRGTDAGARTGPDLTHLSSRRMIAAGMLPNTPGALAGWITDPQRLKPGAEMPANPLPADDLQALVAYLESLT